MKKVLPCVAISQQHQIQAAAIVVSRLQHDLLYNWRCLSIKGLKLTQARQTMGFLLLQGSATYNPMPQQQVSSNSTPGLMQPTPTVQDFPISFLAHFSSPPSAMIFCRIGPPSGVVTLKTLSSWLSVQPVFLVIFCSSCLSVV